MEVRHKAAERPIEDTSEQDLPMGATQISTLPVYSQASGRRML